MYNLYIPNENLLLPPNCVVGHLHQSVIIIFFFQLSQTNDLQYLWCVCVFFAYHHCIPSYWFHTRLWFRPVDLSLTCDARIHSNLYIDEGYLAVTGVFYEKAMSGMYIRYVILYYIFR